MEERNGRREEKGGGLTDTVLGMQCRSSVQVPLEPLHFISLHTNIHCTRQLKHMLLIAQIPHLHHRTIRC